MGKINFFDLEKHFAFYGAYHSNPINIAIHVISGSLAALLCFLCWIAGACLATDLGFPLAWKVVLVVQLVCWTGQFIGHGVFEKRAPALLDNLLQAFLMAPYFVLLEALQIFFGYEPYSGFHVRVTAKVETEIEEWMKKKEKLLS